MADCHGRVIGRGSTPPIMITDDHKSVVKTAPGSTSITPVPPPTIKEEPEEASAAKRKKRTRDDPTDDARAKRRAKEPSPPLGSRSATGSPLLHQTLMNGAGHGTESWSMRGRGSQPPSAFTTAPSSPQINATPSPATSGASGVYLHYPIAPPSQSEQQHPQAQQIPTSVSTTLDADTFLQSQDDIEVLSATLAAAAATAAESNRSAVMTTTPTKSLRTPSPFEVSMSMSALLNASATAYPSPPSSLSPLPLPPQIHRLIPSSGPTHGGIEVTVLGANFLPTHRCVFGDAVATSTQMWSENTLVCLLPPSAAPGPVVVSFEGIPLNVGGGAGSGEGGSLPLFNYLDNSDRAL